MVEMSQEIEYTSNKNEYNLYLDPIEFRLG